MTKNKKDFIKGFIGFYFLMGFMALIVSRHEHIALLWPIYALRILWDAMFGGVTW